jgi:hypothetical protein
MAAPCSGQEEVVFFAPMVEKFMFFGRDCLLLQLCSPFGEGPPPPLVSPLPAAGHLEFFEHLSKFINRERLEIFRSNIKTDRLEVEIISYVASKKSVQPFSSYTF